MTLADSTHPPYRTPRTQLCSHSCPPLSLSFLIIWYSPCRPPILITTTATSQHAPLLPLSIFPSDPNGNHSFRARCLPPTINNHFLTRPPLMNTFLIFQLQLSLHTSLYLPSSYPSSFRSADYYTEFFDEHFAKVERNPSTLSQDILSAAILAGYPVPLITDRVHITQSRRGPSRNDQTPSRAETEATPRPGPLRLSPGRSPVSQSEPARSQPSRTPSRRR